MNAAVDTRLRGATRWSLAARCPRMAAYGLFGEQPAEPSEDTRLRWARGKLDETWFVENILEPRFGRDNIIREKAVPWPAEGLPVGELHTDAFVTTEKRPYEIKSHFDGEPMDSDYVQLCGQIHFDPDVDDNVGVLVVIDRDLRWEALPVVLTDERVEQVEAIAAQVADAGRTGVLPEKVCQRPADGRARMCPYVDLCFADWEPPDALDLSGDVAELAREAARLDAARKPLQAEAALADSAYKAAKAKLDQVELQPGRDYVGDRVVLRKTVVADRESLSLKKAREAGMWTAAHDELLGSFVSLVGGHSRYRIDVVGGNEQATDPCADEFGPVPF